MFGKPKSATFENDRLLHRLSLRYREPMKRYFFKHVSSWAEADDLTQELFLRILRSESFENIENPEPFIFRTAVNLLRDRSRRRKTATNFIAEFSSANAENYEALSPERVLDSKQALDAVLSALSKVDDRTKNIFILHRLEGLKHSEIAAMYGVSVSLVEKSIFKCSIQIAKSFDQF